MDKAELLKILGKRIQYLREGKNLTQVDLVGKMEGRIDTTNISRIESGRTNPTVHTLHRISEALELPLKEIFDFTEL